MRQAPASPASALMPQARERTVLVIEPNALALELYRTALKSLACTVIHAPSGELALELARSRPIDLVLMDPVLPGLSGLETLVGLQDEPHLDTVPIVAVSAVPADQALPPAAVSELSAWLPKPVDLSHLLVTVGRLLR